MLPRSFHLLILHMQPHQACVGVPSASSSHKLQAQEIVKENADKLLLPSSKKHHVVCCSLSIGCGACHKSTAMKDPPLQRTRRIGFSYARAPPRRSNQCRNCVRNASQSILSNLASTIGMIQLDSRSTPPGLFEGLCR